MERNEIEEKLERALRILDGVYPSVHDYNDYLGDDIGEAISIIEEILDSFEEAENDE